MVLTYSSSARSRFSTVGRRLSRHLYRLRRVLVAGVPLFALLLLGPASQFVHARGGAWQEFVYHGQAGSRPYFVYTPDNYHPGTPVPLLGKPRCNLYRPAWAKPLTDPVQLLSEPPDELIRWAYGFF